MTFPIIFARQTGDGHPIALPPPAKVSLGAFTGMAWGGAVLSLLFIISRIYVRIKSFRRLFVDDLLVFVAWLMVLATTIIWQICKEDLFELLAVTAGQIMPSASLPQHAEKALRAEAVVVVLFYSSLWSVKFSFLVFFKRLGQNVRYQKVLWWCIFSVTLASYIACIGTIYYSCLTSPFDYIIGNCATAQAIAYNRATLLANMAIDVITDALIILVPLNMLWKVRISTRQKLALGGIFSITVLIIVFAIIRTTVIASSTTQLPDQSWLYLWSMVEQTVSIIVACLASYRALFTKEDRQAKPRVGPKIKAASDGSSRKALMSLATSDKSTWFHSTGSNNLGEVPIHQYSADARSTSRNDCKACPQPKLRLFEPCENCGYSRSDGPPMSGVHVRHEITTTSVEKSIV